jgi:hypothetical protein
VKCVYKYKILDCGNFSISMPEGAEILCVQMQGDTPCLWAMADPKEVPILRSFCVRGTGHGFDDTEGRYIGTFQTEKGLFIWHLFEKKSPVETAESLTVPTDTLIKALGVQVFLDGNAYCCLRGENLQEGIAGFGETPAAAVQQFLLELTKTGVVKDE